MSKATRTTRMLALTMTKALGVVRKSTRLQSSRSRRGHQVFVANLLNLKEATLGADNRLLQAHHPFAAHRLKDWATHISGALST